VCLLLLLLLLLLPLPRRCLAAASPLPRRCLAAAWALPGALVLTPRAFDPHHRRLAQALNVRLAQPALAAPALGSTTRLLLLLEGNESALLEGYLSRRRRALHEVLSEFTPAASSSLLRTATDSVGEDDEAAPDNQADGTAAADAETDADAADADHGGSAEPSDGLPAAASYVAQLGAAFVPLLVELHNEWHRLFMDDELASEPVLQPAADAAVPPAALDAAAKEAMLLGTLQELCGAYIEVCRRRLQEEHVAPDQLLAGLHQVREPSR
jgi:hypothetical protein